MVFYIQISDGQFINQPFNSIGEARNYCIRHNIHGYQFLDEYQMQELRQEQPDTRYKSLIRRSFRTRETNMRVPVQRYETQKAPNYVRPYQAFVPKTVGRRRRVEE